MSFADLLESQRNDLEALVILLSQEQDLLIANIPDPSEFEVINRDKQEYLQRIASIDAQRRDVQCSLGHTEDFSGAEEAAYRESCTALWHAVSELARQASRRNEINGSLIELRMGHNQRVLRQLRDLQGSLLYEADGQTEKRRGRIEASA